MPKPTDARVVASTLYFLPVATRVPLKFGPEVTTRGHLRPGPPDRRRRPGPDRRGLGRDPAERPLGLAQPAPLRGAARGPQAALPPSWPRPGPASRSRATRSRSATPSSARSCPACSPRLNAGSRARGRADPLARRPGRLLGLRPGPPRRLRRPPRPAGLRDLRRPVHERRPRRLPRAGRGLRRLVRRADIPPTSSSPTRRPSCPPGTSSAARTRSTRPS